MHLDWPNRPLLTPTRLVNACFRWRVYTLQFIRQAFSWHLRQSLAGVHEAQLDDRMHANRRVLIILALEVLGQADLVGTPVEYDKVAPTMQHPNSAGAPQQYLNGQGAAPPDVWSSKCPSHPAPA